MNALGIAISILLIAGSILASALILNHYPNSEMALFAYFLLN